MVDTSPSPSSNTSQTGEQSGEIANADNVSRQVFSPRMGMPGNFDWLQVFEFPSNAERKESVVWRKIAVTDDEVHSLGRNQEVKQKAAGKNANYIGFMTARAGEIRAKRTTRGHTFKVYPDRSEGDAHAVIQIIAAEGTMNLNKSDKSDVRAIMQCLFEPNFTAAPQPT